MDRALYIGLMSGTSLDGVDGVLVDFAPGNGLLLRVLAHAHRPFEPALAAELLALNRAGGTDELHRAALAGNAVARRYADVVADLAPPAGVIAIGAHGQTVRHRPGEFDGTGYTLQLLDPALLAELTGIDVVADLRSRDVAAGGQGAPLVPAFHRAVFARAGRDTALLNLGGIANLTALRADGTTLGYDCGPANALMDLWCRRHTGASFDAGGAWAASGQVDAALLARLRAEPYFALPAPKSTGRDLFHADWLDRHLAAAGPTATADVQATLAELTASVAADALRRDASQADELIVCGGGAANHHLMQRLAALLPGVRVMPSDERGLPANQVEASAFAWLARAWFERQPGNLSSVTGARGPRVLGALHPAH
ncbi:MAG: anhydro-N-acetylmuramic acid kinase [Proteobacteria bacterium]|nr:anhydro-N-acetylmuramic acid kinase [Pseudomonadota bacterium]